jgi:phage terminase small subunit
MSNAMKGEGAGAKLTDKQRAFVESYLQNWNASKSARCAGYKGNDNTLQSVGWENLRKPAIRDAIAQRCEENRITADEVLSRLRSLAQSDLGDLCDVLAHDTIGGILRAARDAGLSYLIKKVKESKDGVMEVEFHDSLRALDILARHLISTKLEDVSEEREIVINLIPIEKDPVTGRLVVADGYVPTLAAGDGGKRQGH